MRSLLHMLMMVLAITPLIAPPQACKADLQLDHACCAPHAQLAAQCCTSSAAPVPAIPNQRNDAAKTGYLRAPLRSLIVPAAKVSSNARLDGTTAVPTLLPATILRT